MAVIMGLTKVDPAPFKVIVAGAGWRIPWMTYPVTPLIAAIATRLMMKTVLLIPPLRTIAPGTVVIIDQNKGSRLVNN